ncbi:hypothetical protein O3P69_009463 [Scylla paramamosain]|uniref:Uncharacterized protein n=1 Tax=Scylla paramamosain TaxID=85552 RepID=A0AAW0SUN4_SCYPA
MDLIAAMLAAMRQEEMAVDREAQAQRALEQAERTDQVAREQADVRRGEPSSKSFAQSSCLGELQVVGKHEERLRHNFTGRDHFHLHLWMPEYENYVKRNMEREIFIDIAEALKKEYPNMEPIMAGIHTSVSTCFSLPLEKKNVRPGWFTPLPIAGMTTDVNPECMANGGDVEPMQTTSSGTAEMLQQNKVNVRSSNLSDYENDDTTNAVSRLLCLTSSSSHPAVKEHRLPPLLHPPTLFVLYW